MQNSIFDILIKSEKQNELYEKSSKFNIAEVF